VIRYLKTLEEIENPINPETPINEEDAQPFADDKDNEDKRPRPRITYLKEGMVNIRLNQKGVNYKSLFGDYLKTAKEVKVVDPYIRAPFQIDNLLELIQTIREVSDYPEELKIHVSTQNEDERVPEMIDIFDGIKDELQGYGIEFTYDFKADHDRWIEVDNGWRIILSRGLDVYEKFDRFSLGNIRQSERRCRAFSVIYKKI